MRNLMRRTLSRRLPASRTQFKHAAAFSTATSSATTPPKPSYLDMQATTPTDPRVVDTMLPFWHLRYGNPHSRSHVYGWDADEAVEHARKQIGNLIGATEKEIIFTSGATESNNQAVKG